MSERKSSSRWRHFLLMLPFFFVGVAIPVYFFGFSGDGPPQMVSEYTPRDYAPDGYSSGDRGFRRDRSSRFGIVSLVRRMFEDPIAAFGSPRSSLGAKLVILAVVFGAGYLLLRFILSFAGAVVGFFVHKAAGPMFMGFLAVGSTWGIHETVAQQFGMTWAAATVSITAAIATLFTLAGFRIRG